MWRELYKLHNIWLIYVNYDISISTSILLSVTSKPTWDILYVKFSQQYIMHVNDSSNVRTYVLVLAQDICVMRVSYQLSSELSFAGVYPGTGGVSGNRSRNLPNPVLKLSRVSKVVEHSKAELLWHQKSCRSHFELTVEHWWLAFIPCLECRVNCILTSFGAWLLIIYYTCIIQHRSLRRWRDKS